MQVGLKFHIEQAGYEGLIALAVSDSLCCLTGLVAATATGGSIRVVYETHEAWKLYARLYVPCVQNALVRTSTWLTVLTAAGRYAAICRPMHARRLIGVRETRVSVVAVFVLSAALELPSFWTFDVVLFECATTSSSSSLNDSLSAPPTSLLLVDHGSFELNVPLRTAFSAVWTTLGFVVPAGALAFCNVQLVRSLRESARLRRRVCRVASPRTGDDNNGAAGNECSRCRRYRGYPHRTGGHGAGGRRGSHPDRLTPTLIAVVGAFLALVAPSELVHHVGRHSDELVRRHAELYDVVLAVANLLQTVDFAFNFVLYCVVNVQFRDTCRHLVLGVLCRRRLRLRRRRRHHHQQQQQGWRRRTGYAMATSIGRRRLLLELGTGFAAVGAPTPAVAGYCRCSTLRRAAADGGTRDASSLQRRGGQPFDANHHGVGDGAARLSLTVTGPTATAIAGRRRSSAATVTVLTACTVGGGCGYGSWERRKLSSAGAVGVVETIL